MSTAHGLRCPLSWSYFINTVPWVDRRTCRLSTSAIDNAYLSLHFLVSMIIRILIHAKATSISLAQTGGVQMGVLPNQLGQSDLLGALEASLSHASVKRG